MYKQIFQTLYKILIKAQNYIEKLSIKIIVTNLNRQPFYILKFGSDFNHEQNKF